MLTSIQVIEQKQRFENFIKSANLVKIGKTYVGYILAGRAGVRYNYITRVLKFNAKVGHSYYIPDTNIFYGDKLIIEAMNAYFDSIKKIN